MCIDPHPPKTPLMVLLQKLTLEQKTELARLSNTQTTYLYALASCNRVSCRSNKAARIESATRALAKKYKTPVVTMYELATMCECAER